MKNSTLIYTAISIGMVLSAVMLGGLIREGYMDKVDYLIKNSTIEKFVRPLVNFGFMSEETSVIQHATVGFKLDNFVVDPSPETGWTGDEYFANVVSQCVFHSTESFEPLCVICKLKDADGNIIGAGIIGETFDQNYVASTLVNIDIQPLSENQASHDVHKVHDVKVEICQDKEGCTPGYWKNHLEDWVDYSPGDLVGDVFIADSTAGNTLLEALNFGGGEDLDGAERILLRAAVAGLLSASHPDVSYPNSVADIISSVNTAIASADRDTMLDLATQIDNDNNEGCPL